ncbi:MAG TPA: hypothetical protein VF532_02150 [Candidatus Angelobacter sp.]
MLVPRKFVCALVAMTILAPPLLACAPPGVQMSEEEMACCRHMAEQCGGSNMPDSHSCCNKSATIQSSSFQIKQRYSSSLEVVAHGTLAVPPQATALPVATIEKDILAFPESPPGHNTILRI